MIRDRWLGDNSSVEGLDRVRIPWKMGRPNGLEIDESRSFKGDEGRLSAVQFVGTPRGKLGKIDPFAADLTR